MGPGVAVGSIPIIVNPKAMHADVDKVRLQANRWLAEDRFDLRVLEGDERASDAARRALREGAAMIVAVGGDGTVSGVAEALTGTDVPLAIIPMGTANMLSEHLDVPKSPEKAMELALHEHSVKSIDALRLGGRLYLLNAGVGVSSHTVRKMRHDDKRRFGLMAYIMTGAVKTLSFPPADFRVTIDGKVHEFRGIEVSLINAGFHVGPTLPNMPDIQPDDGSIDVLIVWTPTPAGYFRHLGRALASWTRVERNVRWLKARSEVQIEADRVMPVQADGDLVGETPVRLQVVKGAVRVVVPPELPPSPGEST